MLGLVAGDFLTNLGPLGQRLLGWGHELLLPGVRKCGQVSKVTFQRVQHLLDEGIDERGAFLTGTYEYILYDDAAHALFARITDQLPVDKDGEPIVNFIEAENELDFFCPIPA